jgi:hypothetical protein
VGTPSGRSDALRPMSLRAALEAGIDSVTIDSCRRTVQLLRDPVTLTLGEYRARSCPTIRRFRAKHLEEQQRLAALRASGGQDAVPHHAAFRRLGVSFDDSVLRSALGMILQDHIPASLRSLLCPSSSDSEEERLQKSVLHRRTSVALKTSSASIVNGGKAVKERSLPLSYHRTARGLCGDAHMRIVNWLKLHSVGGKGKQGTPRKVPPRRAVFPDDKPPTRAEDDEPALALEDADYINFQIGFQGQYECFRRPLQLLEAPTADSDNEAPRIDATALEVKLRLSVGGLSCDGNDDSDDSFSICSFTSEDMLQDDFVTF